MDQTAIKRLMDNFNPLMPEFIELYIKNVCVLFLSSSRCYLG